MVLQHGVELDRPRRIEDGDGQAGEGRQQDEHDPEGHQRDEDLREGPHVFSIDAGSPADRFEKPTPSCGSSSPRGGRRPAAL